MPLTNYKRRGVSQDLVFNEISFSTQLILQTAKELGITYETLPYTGLFKLNYRGKTEYLHAQPPSLNTRSSVYCCNNKAITKSLLRNENISTPKGFVISSKDSVKYWISVYNALAKPLVVKPIDSSLAKNVYTNINSQKNYLSAIKSTLLYYGNVSIDLLVEEMFTHSTEYRILVSREKVIGIMSRIPPNIVGDGEHTIKELVGAKNQHIWRGGKFALHNIKLGRAELSFIAKQGLKPSNIPAKNTQVFLLASSPTNIDDGGDTIDCTHKVHASVVAIALKSIRAIPGLSWAGIDFFSKDIKKPQGPNDYIVLEINTSPNIAWQEFPAVGRRKHVALEYLKVIFPELKSKPNKTIKVDPRSSHITRTVPVNYISPTISL
jgi:D-alanine-D-alanine ligase-like ATP-grasp enzyme